VLTVIPGDQIEITTRDARPAPSGKADPSWAGPDFASFVRVFIGFMAGISAMVAALPLVLTNFEILPALDNDFDKLAQVMVSIVCLLLIAILFHHRRGIMHACFGPGDGRHGGAWAARAAPWAPLSGLAITVASLMLYWWAYRNATVVGAWIFLPYTLIFAAPVATLCFIVLGEYRNLLTGSTDLRDGLEGRPGTEPPAVVGRGQTPAPEAPRQSA
jgi:hypothetical protein